MAVRTVDCRKFPIVGQANLKVWDGSGRSLVRERLSNMESGKIEMPNLGVLRLSCITQLSGSGRSEIVSGKDNIAQNTDGFSVRVNFLSPV